MQQMVEYICRVMEERYCVDLKGKWICTKEKNLDCICLSGEILNQALSNLLLFFEVPNNCKVVLKRIGDSICPIVLKDGEQYVGIAKNEKNLFDLNAINYESCIRDDKYYIKPKLPLQSIEKYKCSLKLAENMIQDNYNIIGSQDRNKYRFLLHIMKRIRILENGKQVHSAFLCLRCFLAPGKTLSMINNYVKDDALEDEDKGIILTFIDKYIGFLNKLVPYVNGYSIRPNHFTEIFTKNWELNISWILKEYEDEDSTTELLEVLRSSLSDNLNKTTFKKWKKILEQIKGDKWKEKKEKIKNNIDEWLKKL